MAAKITVPENISEEYYQINTAILSSFPKYRPPLDLFVFNPRIAQLVTFARKDTRLSNEQVEEMHQLCEEGDLFVSRADHPIYSKHIVKQLDLILVDHNIKESEAADICKQALKLRLGDFFEQPVKPVFELLFTDLMVVTEFLWTDMHRIKLFMRRLFREEYSLAHHSFNTWAVGTWIYMQDKGDAIRRRDLDQASLALLLHDVGMAKVPAFIIAKLTPLKPEEREKIPPHTLLTFKIMQKLEVSNDLMRQATLEHHERLDGSGYPQHSKEISPFGRIAAVADSFSAMIQKRPYAEAKDLVAAAQELSSRPGKYDSTYSGRLLAAFLDSSLGNTKP